MDSLRSARAALMVVTLLFAASAAWAYDMEFGGGGIPRTRNPDLVRSSAVPVEALVPTTVILGPSMASQGRQPKPYASDAKPAKKVKKSKKNAKRSLTPDPSVRQGKVTDGDPVLAKP